MKNPLEIRIENLEKDIDDLKRSIIILQNQIKQVGGRIVHTDEAVRKATSDIINIARKNR